MRAVEGGKAISFIGFRDVQIVDVGAFLKNIRVDISPATIQIVDSEKVAGKLHLFFAFLNAQKSFEHGREISGNLEVETLLYAASTRQISRAIEMLGVKSQTSSIVAMIFASNEREVVDAEEKLMKLVSGIRDDSVLCMKKKSKVKSLIATFGITALELQAMTSPGTSVNEALTWLIVERVSILAVKH